MPISSDSAGNYFNTTFTRVVSSGYPGFTFYDCVFTESEIQQQMNEMFAALQTNAAGVGTFAYRPFGNPNPTGSQFASNQKNYRGWFLRLADEQETFSGAIPTDIGWEDQTYAEKTPTPSATVYDWVTSYDTPGNRYSADWDRVLLWMPMERRFKDNSYANNMAIFDEAISANVFNMGTVVNLYYPVFNATRAWSLDDLTGQEGGQTASANFMGDNCVPGIDIYASELNYKGKYRFNMSVLALTIQFYIRIRADAANAVLNKDYEILFIKFPGRPSGFSRISFRRTATSTWGLYLDNTLITGSNNLSDGNWHRFLIKTNGTSTGYQFSYDGSAFAQVGNVNYIVTDTPFAILRLFENPFCYIDGLSIRNWEASTTEAYSVSALRPAFTVQKSARLWLPELTNTSYKHWAIKGHTPVVGGDSESGKGYLITLGYREGGLGTLITPTPATMVQRTNAINYLSTANTHSVGRLWFFKEPYQTAALSDKPSIWFDYTGILQNVNDLPNMSLESKYFNMFWVSGFRNADGTYAPLTLISARRGNLFNSFGQLGGATDVAVSGDYDPYADRVLMRYSNKNWDIKMNGATFNRSTTYINDSPRTGGSAIAITTASFSFSNLTNNFANELRQLDNWFTIDFWVKNISGGTPTGLTLTNQAWITGGAVSINPTQLVVGGVGRYSWGANFNPTINGWNHFAIVRKYDTVKYFGNGRLLWTTTTTLVNQFDPIFVAALLSGGNNIWAVDEFRITRAVRWWTDSTTVDLQVFTPPSYSAIHYPIVCSNGATPKGFNQTDPDYWATDFYVRDKITVSGINPYVGKCSNLLYGHDGLTTPFIPLRVYKIPTAAAGGSPYFICVGKFGSQSREALLMRVKIVNDTFL